MIVNYKLRGVPVNPVDREKIFIEVNHDQGAVINQPRPHVGISNLYFAREDVDLAIGDLSQSPGITEGIPLDIEITEGALSGTIHLYVDFTDGGFRISRNGLNAGIKMVESLDRLDDIIDSFSYESMYNETGVAPFQVDGITYNSYQDFLDRRCIYVPYVISTIPNWHDAFIALFGMTYIGTELFKIIKEIEAAAASLATDPFSWGEIARITILVAFATLLFVTLIALINQLIACLIQPLKYHGAMLMTDLLKITAVKLGLQESSSIWDQYPWNQWAYIPEKFSPVEAPGNLFSLMGFSVNGFGSKGYTSPGYAPTTSHDSQTPGIQHGYFNGFGGDFLRFIKSICNGKYILPASSNTLQLERRDFLPAATPFQLDDIRQDFNGYNLDELDAVIKLRFAVDLNEKNCVDFIDASGNPFYTGTVLEATTRQITTNDPKLVCLKGLREIAFAAARGVAKDKLTFIESVIKDIEIIWSDIETVAVTIALILADIIIGIINTFIALWNLIIDVLHAITDVLNVIIDAIDTLPGIDIDDITVFDNGGGKIGYITAPDPFNYQSLPSHNFSNRLNALLVENDILAVPKVVMVDTARAEFQGGLRVAYLHNDNAKIVNCKYLWDHVYFIDAMVGAINNRKTKISPALNKPEELNRAVIAFKDFMNLVYNPGFNDSWGEQAIANSVRWYLEQNGAAEFDYFKPGWLKSPQNPNSILRAQEIAINLTIDISLPNGQ